MKDTGIKFETLHRGFNFKKVFIGLIVIVAIGSVVILKGSKANYTYEQIIPFAEGEVHIKKYDFKIMAMYQQTDKSCTDGSDNCYKEITEMPESGYKINEEKSGCYKDSNKETKDTNARLYTLSSGEHVMSKLDKEDKCYVYFDIYEPPKTMQQIIADNYKTVKTRAAGTFNTTITDTTTGVIYKSTSDANQKDNDGKDVYYFAGAPTDNWVKFGQIKSNSNPIWWRIIRINGDGSIRMIYAGTGTSAPNTIGSGTQLSSESEFNASSGDNAYVGYMYGATKSDYTNTHKNENPSTIKKALDDWYNNTSNLTTLSTKLSDTTGFCGDRTPSSSETTSDGQGGTGATTTYYGGYVRVKNKNNPTFKCSNLLDLYKTPIGLITADEVAFAGGVYATSNKNFYLYNGNYYWTMSPYNFDSGSAVVFFVNSSNPLSYASVNNAFGVRPVINLKADVSFTGSGTTSSPYEVS